MILGKHNPAIITGKVNFKFVDFQKNLKKKNHCDAWTNRICLIPQNKTQTHTHLLGAKAEAEATRAATIRVCFIMIPVNLFICSWQWDVCGETLLSLAGAAGAKQQKGNKNKTWCCKVHGLKKTRTFVCGRMTLRTSAGLQAQFIHTKVRVKTVRKQTSTSRVHPLYGNVLTRLTYERKMRNSGSAPALQFSFFLGQRVQRKFKKPNFFLEKKRKVYYTRGAGSL